MAAAHVQSKSAKDESSTTSVAVTLTSNLNVGETVVVYVSWGDITTVEAATVSDNLGNTYTRQTNCDKVDSTNAQQSSMWVAKVTTGGSATITANNFGGTSGSRAFKYILAEVVSGVDQTTPVNGSTGNFQASPGTGTNAVTSTAITTTKDGCFIVGGYSDSTGGTITLTAGTTITYTKREEIGNTTGADTAIETGIQSTQGSLAATWTINVNHRSLTAMVALQPAGVTLSPASLTRTRALGAPTVNPKLGPASLTRTRALGAAAVIPRLLPLSLVHTRGQGAAKVNVSLKPLALVHTRALGTITVSSTLTGPTVIRQWSFVVAERTSIGNRPPILSGPGNAYGW